MKAYITNGITQDGFGARTQRAIHTMAFTYFLRDTLNVSIDYLHTPFYYEGFGEDYTEGEGDREVGDNVYPYNEVTRAGYLKRANLWEDHLKFECTKITDLDLTQFTIEDASTSKQQLMYDLRNGTYDNKVYIVKYLQHDFNSGLLDFNIVDHYHSEICANFAFSRRQTSDIIVHIRRKDAIDHGYCRYVDDELYLKLLTQLDTADPDNNLIIYTQRKNFNSQKFNKWKVVYDDEIEDYIAFTNMVNCSKLITSKSSFSLCAGMLNTNYVGYITQPTVKLERWTTINV